MAWNTRRGSRKQKQPPGLQRKRSKPKPLIEVDRVPIPRVHHDRKNGEGTTGAENAVDQIG